MSNKKTLLTENTIRRFMKLASIAPLAETFVDKIKEEEETELEEVKEESSDEELAEGGMDIPYKNDDEMGEPEMDMEPELGMEPEGEGEGDLGDALTDMMQAIAAAVEEVASTHGVDLAMDVEGDEPEMDMPEEEPEMELPAEEPEMDMEPMEEETESTPEVEELNEDDLLEKITQKVAARLQQEQELKEEDAADVDAEVQAEELKETKINKLTDVIVERIFSSLKK